MIKKIFNNSKGLTLLEGLIALSLLAIVVTGTFAVLLSTSRRTSTPDIREELVLAVERAHEQLQTYVTMEFFPLSTADSSGNIVPAAFRNGLCGAAARNAVTDNNPLGDGTHNIKCMLPLVCDQGNIANDCNDSTGSKNCFVYRVNDDNAGQWSDWLPDSGRAKAPAQQWTDGNVYSSVYAPFSEGKTITFEIRCNGYTLTN